MVNVDFANQVDGKSVLFRCTMRPKVSLGSTVVSSMIVTVTVLDTCPEVKLTDWFAMPV
jgi:hypothetical protein